MGTHKNFSITFVDGYDGVRKEVTLTAPSKERAMAVLKSFFDPDFGGQILYVDAVSANGKRRCVYEY